MEFRLLVVEDEPDIRDSMRELLAMVPGCRIEVASGYAEGRRRVQVEPWDLVISDERLPDGRGVDILAEAHRRSPATLRVLMSAFQDFDMLLRGVNHAHIDYFIQKPWEPDEVLAWLEGTVAAVNTGGDRGLRPPGSGPREAGAPLTP